MYRAAPETVDAVNAVPLPTALPEEEMMMNEVQNFIPAQANNIILSFPTEVLRNEAKELDSNTISVNKAPTTQISVNKAP